MRRGRLDETFFVDLPDADAREAILRVHLCTRAAREVPDLPPLTEPWAAYAAVVRDVEGVSGAEIEAAVVEARLDAFAQTRPLTPDDLQRAFAATVPLSRTRAEEIEGLRAWARHRARPA
jgi:SpoVK/Ycf46/Vps4 family AAA+-type ATPase